LKSLTRLSKYFKRYKYRLVFGLLFVTASNLFAVFPAQLVRKSIDSILNIFSLVDNQNSLDTYHYNEIISLVIKFSLLILAFALIKGVFMYLMRQTIIVMSRLIEYDMKNDIFIHYQRLSQSFYRQHATGDLMARISEDVSRVRMFTGPAIMYMMNLIVTLIVVLWAMFRVNVTLSWWVLAPLPILSLIILYVNNLINRRSDAIQFQLSTLNAKAQETFAGMRVVKAFGLENIWQSLFSKETDVYKYKNLSLARVDALFFPSMLFLTGLSSLFTIWIGGNMVVNGIITIGNIAEFTIYVNLLVWPVTALGFTISLTQRAAASQQRINEFLDADEAQQLEDGSMPFVFNHSIRFDQVCFTYSGKNIPALHNVSFELKKGETLSIIGSTGSGKSTILQLLMRLYNPSSGDITIDGEPIARINLPSMRQQIGYAPQDVFLFSDSIRNNICFGNQTDIAMENEMIEASIMAALHDSIQTFSSGYDTVVGERGITLSGGQKQRVALARALIRKPQLLLLDDTLSAVDAETEKHIIDSLRANLHHQTLLLLTHRATAAAIGNHILVLDEGRVAEYGTFDELMNRKGAFYELYTAQTIVQL
jgi:ATP-binding cassette subfamily B multidrug efflux pump